MDAAKRLGLLAFLTAACVAAARAETPQAGTSALRRSAAGAEVFSQAADGAIAREALPTSVPAVAFNPGAGAALTPTRPERRDFAVTPPAVFVPRSAPRAAQPLRRSALAAAAAEGGLVLALIAAGLWRALPATDVALAQTTPAVAPAPVFCAPALPTAATSPVFAERAQFSAPDWQPYVDTRMPAGTWRAISSREQALIETWDLSREKALGLASLEQWLDAHPAAGVDAAALKIKLARA